ncbi:hypothetical protein Tco_1257501 [Tanacetum coccineum]
MNYLRVWDCKAVVRLLDPNLKTLGERGIECIFFGYAKHSKAFRFFVIEPNESVSINSIIKFRDAIFDENRFFSVPKPSLNIPKGTEDIGGSVVPEKVIEEDGPKIFDEAMKSHDVALWKEAINDEMDSIMGNNTWVLSDLPSRCKPLACKWIFKRKLKVYETIEKLKERLAIQIFGTDQVYVDLTKNFLSSRFSMKDMREANVILVGKLSRYTSNLGTQHWQAIQRVLKYLKKTMDYKLTYTGYPSVLEEKTYITGSTIESEFVALASASKEAEWLRNLILEISLWSEPIVHIFIHCDSGATLAKAYSRMYNGKSRHLGVRHSMIRELITNGVISIEFVRSQQNLAGHLTKGLTRDLVIKSTKGMGLKSKLGS